MAEFSNNRKLGNRATQSVSVEDFGAIGDWTGSAGTDDSTAIQAAITAAAASLPYSEGGVTVYAAAGKSYLHSVGLVIPARVTLDMRGALLSYSGTGIAVTLGDSDTTMSFSPGLINFRMHLQDKASIGVRLHCTRGARVTGEIEALYAPFDNTRSNIGVDIQGHTASCFFNHITVDCNHMHIGFNVHIASGGTVEPTDQFFHNCTSFGDWTTDSGSRGFVFDGVGVGGGSVISGGNLEMMGSAGVYITGGAGRISVFGLRFEIDGSVNDVVLNGTGHNGNTFIGCNGLANVLDSTASQDYNNIQFSAGGSLLTADLGKMGLPGKGIKIEDRIQFAGDEGTDWYILTPETSAGSGRIIMQAGAGSASWGSALHLHGSDRVELPYTGGTGDFTVGLTVTEATSGTVGIISKITGDTVTGTLLLHTVSGNFTGSLAITDTGTGAATSATEKVKAGDAVIGLSQGAGGSFRVNNSATDAGSDLFGIGPLGQIKTNQDAANTNTPSGATAHQLPIYNESGTLLGYIPIYGSAW